MFTFSLRSPFLRSLVLGGLMVASPAWAGDAEEGESGPSASIVDMALENGALTVRILWNDEKEMPPASAKLLSYDGQENVLAAQEVELKPGQVSEVKLFGALAKPWETGWAQKLVLRDSRGEAMVVQPYDVSLDCQSEDECGFAVSPGVGSTPDVVHVSAELTEALDAIKAKTGGEDVDLVKAVSESFPNLRGEALVYADQMAQRVAVPIKCYCRWTATKGKTPSGLGYNMSNRNPAGYLSGWNGPGAKHQMTIGITVAGSTPQGQFGVASGSSTVGLSVTCSKDLAYARDIKVRFPDNSEQIFPSRGLISSFCTGCPAEFTHFGRISARTYVRDAQPNSFAYASEHGTWRVNTNAPTLDQYATWNASFDKAGTDLSWGASSTNRVDFSGQVSAQGMNYASAVAEARNSYAQAIYGEVYDCPAGYDRVGTVWDYATTQGTPQFNSLRNSIRYDFYLAYWNLSVNP
ncbi:hypothetical protein JY651_16485 [Pyxidicoccus parkwayensis]|uniref:Uncharacterized protein n=1 Tax=Pyxidicoccus parkwayensis TaxID=2813578 RepID=A0ABX7P7D7_9BACT|nr:hypothetical protein [Pyxidicoccus parkwaysis]QSQ26424.1 hypothetical protein JY651_16485 [Pyxidicoccus parkwaysis]